MRRIKNIIICLGIMIVSVSPLFAGEESWVVDKIVIDGTWMTRDIVVLSALDFSEGDTITEEDLDIAEKSLYGLSLFSTVEFTWETEADDVQTLHILAKDQLHIMPLVAIDGSSKTIKLGAADGNFLGFNVDLSLAYEQEKEFAQYDFIKRRLVGSVSLPDSLLNGFTFGQKVNIGITGNAEHNIETDFSLPTRWFNDWKWSFDLAKNLDVNYISTDGIKESGYSSDSWKVGTTVAPSVGYDLYPSFNLSWQSETISDTGIYDTVFTGGAGTTSFLNLGADLAYGEIRTKNSYFQKNGGKVFTGYNLGIKTSGDSSIERTNHKFNIGAEGHLLAFKWLELAGYADYGITSSSMSSNLYDINVHSTRDRSVPGLKLQGNTYYSITAQAHLTYINTAWFALEHVSWFDVARGGTGMSDLFSAAPKMAVGTGLRLRIPTIPWLYFYIDVQWALPATGQDIWGIKI